MALCILAHADVRGLRASGPSLPVATAHMNAYTLRYIQIYNAPYTSIRKRIWSAAMAPDRLHIAGFEQFSFKTVFKCQKRIS